MKTTTLLFFLLFITINLKGQSGSSIFSSDTLIVCGSSYTLSAPSGLTSYSWSTGAGTQSITTNRSGWYWVSAIQNGSLISDSVYVSLLYVNIINNDTTICPGTSLVLTAETAFNYSCTGYPAQQYSTWTSVGPLGIIYKWNNIYYIRTLTDVLQSNNLDGPWVSMGFSTQTGVTGAAELLGVDAIGRLHVGTINNGLYVYNNGIWSSNGLSGTGAGSQFFTLLSSGRIVFSLSGTSAGIYYSDDNGNTWIASNAPATNWYHITVANNGNLFAVGPLGVIKSMDNGTTWTSVNNQVGAVSSATGITKDCNGILWLVADRTLFSSSDNGNSWMPSLQIPGFFTSNPILGSLLATSNGEVYYYGFISPLVQGLFVTRDGGLSWSLVTGFPGVLSYLKEIDGQLIACTNLGVYALTLQPIISLQWSTGATTATITANPTQTTTYYVTARNGLNSCSDSVTVRVGAVFSGLFPVDTVYHCGPDVSISAPAGYSSYQWSSGETTRTITVTDPGLYYVQAQPALGCPVFDSVFVNILNIDILNSDTTICPGDSLELSVDPGQGLRISCFDPAVVKGGNSINGYHGVAVDNAKNYFLGGTFSGNTLIGGIPVASVGGQDLFLAKYDSCGNPLWVITGGSVASGDDAGSVDTDGSGNVYFTGRYNQPLTLTGTGGTSFNAAYTPSGNAAHQDGFVVKISPSGQILWGATIQGGSNDGFGNVTVDHNDCAIVTGGFNGCCPSTFAAIIYGPNGSIGVNSFGSNYGTGVMVKFDPTGNILWRATIHNRDVGMDRTAVDASNNIYVVGAFRSWSMGTPAQFIDGAGANNTIFNPGIGLAFLVKLNSNGIWQWGVSMGNQGDGVGSLTGASDVRVDASGNPWVCGTYSGAAITFYSTSGATITQPASISNRGYLVRYSAAGVPLSSLSHQQSTGATGFTGLSVTAGSVAVTGYYSGGNQGGNDALLLMYDLSGQLMQSAVPGGGGEDYLTSIDWNGSNYVVAGATSSILMNVDGVNLNGSCNFLWNASSFGVSANTILWSTGDTTSTITVHPSATTTYYVTVSNGYHSCRDSVKITVNNLNSNLFIQDTVSVCGSSYTITAPAGYSSYLWNTGATVSAIVTTTTGWHSCTVLQGACPITDSIFISILNSDIINNDTTICPLNGDSLSLSVIASGSRPNQSCTGLSLFNYENWTSIAPPGAYSNIFRDPSGYYLRSSTDVLESFTLIGPWTSMNFSTQIGNTCAGSMLGRDWSGKLLVSTCHNSLYGLNSGTWLDLGLGGFGCSGNFMSRLANGRIIVEKNGFLRDLYISDNNGATWTNVTNVDNDYFDMILAPNGNIYVCGGSNTPSMTGLIKSVDNGNSFSQINAQLGISYCSGFAKDCAGAIYAIADNKIFKSTDGNIWNQQCFIPSFFTVNPGYSYMVVASNGDYYLWSYSGPGMCGFFKSINQGITWSQISNFPTAATQITRLKEIDGHIVVTTGQGTFAQSIQRGISILWSTGDTSRSIRVSPTQTTTYYCTVSNGITSCTDSVTITVNQPTSSITSQSSCDSLRWNGTLYTASGNYSFLTVNSAGCDSTANLDLTINPSTHNVILQSACDTFRWNGILYTQSGNYVNNYLNQAGCASADTLILSINSGDFTSDTMVVCDSVRWNAVLYTSSGVYVHNYLNSSNCPSADTLHLTVNAINNNLFIEDTISVCAAAYSIAAPAGYSNYQWSTGDTTPAIYAVSSGWYSCVIQFAGCTARDSVLLSLLQINILNNDTTICQGGNVVLTVVNSIPRPLCSQLPPGLNNGLIGWYPFCGNANDESGNGNHGSVYGATLALDRYGRSNNSYYFNGLSNKIEVPATNQFDIINLSISTWISTPVDRVQKIVSKSNWSNAASETFSLQQIPGKISYHKKRNSGCVPAVGWDSYGCNIPSNFLNSWHHIVITQDATTIRQYLDGVMISTFNPVGPMDICPGGQLKFGAWWAGDPAWFNGNIDDIGIWNRSLAPMEVYNLYNWGNSHVRYLWSTGDTTETITVTPTQTTTYYCTVSNGITSCTDSVTITVNQPTSSSTTQSSCDSLRWNSTLYTSSGNYSFLTVNSAGCDSTANLDLTINPSTHNVILQSACDTFRWNGILYTQSGNYVNNYLNQAGCPSADTFQLTIIPVNTTVNIHDTSFCSGSTVTITAQTNPVGNYNYTWTVPNGASNPGNQSSVTTAVPGQYSVYATPVSNLLCNSDFEDNLLVGPGNGTFTNQVNVPCWQTTASDQQIEVWGSGTNGVPSYSGIQFIELNANMVSTLFQDFSGVAGTPITVGFAHRGRAGVDVMGVEIGPAGGPYTSLGSFADGNTAWGYYTLNFTLPPSPTGNYRLRFVSISAAGGNITIGNFLDAITVTFTTCPSVPDSCVVTVNQPTSSLTTLSSCDSLRWNGTLYTVSGNYSFLTVNSKGCDSTANLDLTIVNSSFNALSQTVCDSLRWNGTLYTQSGTYIYNYLNANGCASADTLLLTVNRGTFNSTNQTACDSLRWNGTLYTQSGTYIYNYLNANGCASADTLRLAVNRGTFNSTTQTICDSLRWNGILYTQSGTYIYNYLNANGCASADTLLLTVNRGTFNSTTQTVCDSLRWNGTLYTQSGTYIYNYPNANGCASQDTLRLTVNRGTFTSAAQTVCDSLRWNGTLYTQSGTYIYNYLNTNGCASADTLRLTISNGVPSSSTATACGSYTWNGNNYTVSGNYLYSFSSGACNITDTLYLTINNGTFTAQSQNACGSYTWNGNNYTLSGTYVYNYNNVNGCASADTLRLIVDNTLPATTTASACNSYAWNGNNYSLSGTYLFPYNSGICNITDTLFLTINTGTFTAQTQSACQSFTWNGNTYSASGTYIYNYNNGNGCASADTLLLNISNGTPASNTTTACGSYTWNGTTYTVSGTYLFSYGVGACNVTDTLRLTVNNGTFTAQNQSACGSYAWNGTNFTQSGTYVYNYNNTNGCPSADTLRLVVDNTQPVNTAASACNSYIWNGSNYTQSGTYLFSYNSGICNITDTLFLTINTGTFTAQTQSACQSFIWNGTTYTASGTYIYTYNNSNGCASADTLRLNISNGIPVSTSVAACGSYTWNGNTYTAGGTYLYSYSAGTCNVTDTLFLTINNGTFAAQSQSACGSYTWNGNTYTLSGTYVYNYNNANGCPSADTLRLTVDNTQPATTAASACNNYTWNGSNYTTSGTYLFSYNSGICNITDTLFLTINTGTFTAQTQSACQNFTWNGNMYTTSGTYIYNYNNGNGCASADTLRLNISNGIPASISVTACDSYTWNGATYTTGGTYLYSYGNGACNVTDTLYLTINNGTFTTQNQTACNTYTWNNNTYLNSGTYLFEYVNSSGCPSADTLRVTIFPGPSLGPDRSLRICFGNTGNLAGLFNTQSLNSTWTYNQNVIAPPVSVSQAGNYFLTATDINGCSDSAIATLIVQPQLVANAGPDDYAQTNSPYTLHGNGGSSCSWTPASPLNNANSCDPVATLSQNTYFVLTVYDDLGCSDTDTVYIRVLDGPAIYVPNAFTPNGDGLNDDFGPITVGYREFEEFFIYNRYGQMVFYTTDIHGKWDGRFRGKLQDTGNFVWLVRVKDPGGKIISRKGNVLLIR